MNAHKQAQEQHVKATHSEGHEEQLAFRIEGLLLWQCTHNCPHQAWLTVTSSVPSSLLHKNLQPSQCHESCYSLPEEKKQRGEDAAGVGERKWFAEDKKQAPLPSGGKWKAEATWWSPQKPGHLRPQGRLNRAWKKLESWARSLNSTEQWTQGNCSSR